MEEYSIKDVISTFGLARSSILYYEKLGLVQSKKNPENGYRIYTHDEINRLKYCVSLKNIGYSVKEICELYAEEERDYDKELDSHINKLTRNIQLQSAYLDQLEHLKEISQKDLDVVEIIDAPEIMFLFSGCEDGYHKINQSKEANRMIQNLPLSGFVEVIEQYRTDEKKNGKIARFIPSKYFSLLFDGLTDQPWKKLGACKALRIITTTSINNYDFVEKFDSYAANHHIQLKDTVYACSYLPQCSNLIYEIIIPIEKME